MIDLRFDDCGKIIELTVDSDSKIKDVLLQFLERIDAPLNLSHVSFRFRGKSLNSPRFIEKNVEEILPSGSLIIYRKQKPMTYSGGQHICPYGCGRYIPDEYKGCTELLQAKPNYFS